MRAFSRSLRAHRPTLVLAAGFVSIPSALRPPLCVGIVVGGSAGWLLTTRVRGSLHVLLDAEQDAVGAEDVARLAEELDLVQVGRQVVGALVLLPRGAAVLGAEDGAAAADGPADLGVGQEDDIEDAVATRLDLELVEGDVDQLGVEVGGTLGDLATRGGHPQALGDLIPHEAHRRDAARRHTVVRHPELVARREGEVEVSSRAHGEVRADAVAHDRVDGSCEVRGALHS
eukprot:scaffold84946_cov66-Phaeocystis_antarctica.AAC.2